jgi:hypothetical protein
LGTLKNHNIGLAAKYMTKKDLFRLIIKLFGLYIIITTVLSVLPSNIVLVLTEIDTKGIIWLTATIGILFYFFHLLVFKPDKIIKWFRLDIGFDDDNINIKNLNPDKISKLAILLVGGILIIRSFPGLLSEALFAFKYSVGGSENNNGYYFGSANDYIYLFTSIINITIGYLLISNVNRVSNYIIQKVDKEEKENIA